MKTKADNNDIYCEVIEEFENKLILNMEDLQADFQKVLDDHFWELIDDEN